MARDSRTARVVNTIDHHDQRRITMRKYECLIEHPQVLLVVLDVVVSAGVDLTQI